MYRPRHSLCVIEYAGYRTAVHNMIVPRALLLFVGVGNQIGDGQTPEEKNERKDEEKQEEVEKEEVEEKKKKKRDKQEK